MTLVSLERGPCDGTQVEVADDQSEVFVAHPTDESKRYLYLLCLPMRPGDEPRYLYDSTVLRRCFETVPGVIRHHFVIGNRRCECGERQAKDVNWSGRR